MYIMDGMCMRCKTKKEMKNVKKTKSKNGRNMVKGECVKCGTKMSKFIK